MTELLASPEAQSLIDAYGRQLVVVTLRSVVADARHLLRTGGDVSAQVIVEQARADLRARQRGRLQRVVNATGVILHTNLGRAPLAATAVEALIEASGYVSLEFDLESGQRGGRSGWLSDQLALLVGAEAAMVVNNGAGALVLALSALSAGREVIVSRGELVEIGGSFRIPDMVAASGVTLREVGTTNRTRIGDYRAALGERTAALLRVHPSNYRIVGFTERPQASEIAALAQDARVPFIHDVGSGLLDDDHDHVPDEPSVRGALDAGADLVVFSGDKLLGGPQAGVVVGSERLVAACRAHPLARALRLDKLRLAAMEATVDLLLQDHRADVPVWRFLEATTRELADRARVIVAECRTWDVVLDVVELESVVGGGAAPGVVMRSVGVRIAEDGPAVLAKLRGATPPVIGRLHESAAILDLRTVDPSDDAMLVSVLRGVLPQGKDSR